MHIFYGHPLNYNANKQKSYGNQIKKIPISYLMINFIPFIKISSNNIDTIKKNIHIIIKCIY